jgi:hypothetical protein
LAAAANITYFFVAGTARAVRDPIPATRPQVGACAMSSRSFLSKAAAGAESRAAAGRERRPGTLHLEQAFGRKARPASVAEADGGIEALVDQVDQLVQVSTCTSMSGPALNAPAAATPQTGEGLQYRATASCRGGAAG